MKLKLYCIQTLLRILTVFFSNPDDFRTARKSLIEQGYVEGRKRNSSVVMEKLGEVDYDLVFVPMSSNGQSIVSDFDFTNCCVAYGKEGLVTNEHFFDDVINRKLRLNTVKMPYHTIQRAGKFIKKGYELDDVDRVQLFNNAAMSSLGPYQEDEYENLTGPNVSMEAATEEDYGDFTSDDIPF